MCLIFCSNHWLVHAGGLFEWSKINQRLIYLQLVLLSCPLKSSLYHPENSSKVSHFYLRLFPVDFLQCCWTIIQLRARPPPLPTCYCGSFSSFPVSSCDDSQLQSLQEPNSLIQTKTTFFAVPGLTVRVRCKSTLRLWTRWPVFMISTHAY